MYVNEHYSIGQYVRYQGYMSINSSDIGRIEEFDVNRIYLFLLNKQEYVWCGYDEIKAIYTTEALLKAIGFSEHENNERKRYLLNDICISEHSIYIENKQQFILLGFCAADFTHRIPDLIQYIDKEDLNLDLLHKDYPSLNNANDLINYLQVKGIQVDFEKVLCSEVLPTEAI